MKVYFKKLAVLVVVATVAVLGLMSLQNTAEACLVVDCVVPVRIDVDIDIKPGSDPNCFSNDGKGVIPVAILGSADFDATTVDPATVELGGLGVKVAGKSGKLLAHTEDVNGDGLLDLVVQIRDVDGAFLLGDTSATLTGNLFDGTHIHADDSICIRGSLPVDYLLPLAPATPTAGNRGWPHSDSFVLLRYDPPRLLRRRRNEAGGDAHVF